MSDPNDRSSRQTGNDGHRPDQRGHTPTPAPQVGYQGPSGNTGATPVGGSSVKPATNSGGGNSGGSGSDKK